MLRDTSRAEAAWALTDLRRRWKALVVLGVLAGVTVGFAMAAVAGARRSDTAVDRFRAATNAADAVVFASQVGVPHPDWDQLRARPEVSDVAVWDLMFGNQDGESGGLLFAAQDDGFLHHSNTPIVVSGRMWDPSAPDEVVVSDKAGGHYPVGSTFPFQAFGVDQGDDAEVPEGPQITFRVVGVVHTINEFLFTDDQIFVGPGFAAQYGDQVQLAENADVRLRNGAADVAALQRDVNDVVAAGTPLLDLHAVSRRVDTTISVEHAALLLLSLAIAVAGGVLIAQTVARSASVIDDDALVLRAVGMTRRRIALAGALPHLLSAVVAVGVAAGTAIAASRYFPVGLSRDIDPNVGTHVDWAVLPIGLVGVAVFVLLDSYLVAKRAARPDRARRGRPSGLVASVRSHTPLAVGLGTSMALESGTGRSRVAVRPALIGAVVGVVGVISTLTINYAVNDALAHPERAGVVWDATIEPSPADYLVDGLKPESVASVAAAVPTGTTVATAGRLVVPVDGVGVGTYALQETASTGAGPIELTLVAGRAPVTGGEAAIGPKTARDLHVDVGDTVAFGEDQTPVRIVGKSLFPPDVHSEFDEGVWVTPAQLEAVTPHIDEANLFQGQQRAILVRFPKGSDTKTEVAALSDAIGTGDRLVSPAEVPVELTNLRNVRALPLALAAFLALLAIAAVSHVLMTSAGRRGRDFAVLRALGVSRRGTRVIVNAQGTAIALVGVVLGVPLGVAIGRTAWRWVADRVPLEDVPPLALIALALVTPIAILVVNALALWPGRRVARLRPAEVLRSE